MDREQESEDGKGHLRSLALCSCHVDVYASTVDD